MEQLLLFKKKKKQQKQMANVITRLQNLFDSKSRILLVRALQDWRSVKNNQKEFHKGDLKAAIIQIEKYNLVQQEILKKAKINRLFQILSLKCYSQMELLFLIPKSTFQMNFVRNLIYKQTNQYKLRIVLRRFDQCAKQQQQREILIQKQISSLVQKQVQKQWNAFYIWNRVSQQKIDEPQVVLNKQEQQKFYSFESTMQLFQTLNNLKYKNLSACYLCIKHNHSNNSTQKAMIKLGRIFQKKILTICIILIDSLKSGDNNQQQLVNEQVVINQSIISSKLNQQLNKLSLKEIKLKRSLVLIKIISDQVHQNQQSIQKSFTKWKKQMKKHSFLQRLKLLKQHNQLEEDYKLYIQQYQQLHQDYQKQQSNPDVGQIYYNTPTQMSERKPQEIQSKQQIIVIEEELEIQQNDAFTDQYIERIEFKNYSLKQQQEQQEIKRQEYLRSYEERKQILLQKIAEKNAS